MRAKAMVVSLLMIAVVLSGCTDAPEEPTPDSDLGGTSVTTEQDTVLEFGPHSGLPTERDENWTATFDEPPQWVLGEWWTIEITDGFVGNSHTVTRVVSGKESTDYLVGMPLDEFNDEVMVLHFPGFGLVQSDTLGFEAHDYLFEPLRFPLMEGDTWDSLWQSPSTVTHLVEFLDHDAMTATISLSGATSGTYVYDANLGAITEWNIPGYEYYKVVDHGFDHEGMVRVPYSHDMTIYHGRVGPVAPIQQSSGVIQDNSGQCLPGVGGCGDAAAPVETFNVPEGYDRASFALIIFELATITDGIVGGADPTGAYPGAPTAAGNGVYQITVTAPHQEQYQATKLPSQGGHHIQGYANDEPAGDWQVQVLAGGPGMVFVEGITYNTYDVDLPSGCVEVTENVHDHGGDCGGHVHNLE